MWGEWYPVFSAICYFGSLGLLVVVHVPWVGRRYQQFRKRDWAFGLLVAGMVTRSLWRGIQEGPVWDVQLAESPLWLRGAIALAVVVFSIYLARLRVRELRQPAGARAG